MKIKNNFFLSLCQITVACVVMAALAGVGYFSFFIKSASAAALVQTVGSSGAGVTSLSATLAPTASNGLIVVCFGGWNPSSVTDNRANTYSLARNVGSNGSGLSIYYAHDVSGGVTSVTAAHQYGTSRMAVSEYSGITSASPLDQTAGLDNGYNGGAAWTSGTAAATSQADELLVGCAADAYDTQTTFTAGSGYTARLTQGGSLFFEDRQVSAIGAYSATGSRAGASGYDILAAFASFKLLGGAPQLSSPIISSFTASPSSVFSGQSSTLSWVVSGSPAPTLSINNSVGTVTGSSVAVSPAVTTTYTLTATNSQGTATSPVTVTVSVPSGDTTAPSGPASLTATAVSSSQINLAWSASSDNVEVTGYRIYRGGVQIGTSVATSYSDASLAASTSYSYSVAAFDAAGNVSAQSTSASATTQSAPSVPSGGGPVLYFSDLVWGPKTGWEGSATKGAAVTVWGKNFGSTRGTSFVTVNGAQVNSSDYAEWGVTAAARGLERITFYLNSGMASGAGTISVTVNSATSNTLPFTISAGTIYFISPTGSNSNNGLYSSAQGAGNGPFKDIYMFNPGQDSYHSAGNRNPSGDGQYIVYARGGTYTTKDRYSNAAFLMLLGPYGSPTAQKALIGYPGETATLDSSTASPAAVWFGDWTGLFSYFTFAKLNFSGGSLAFGIHGNYDRLVGNTMSNMLNPDWAGVMHIQNSNHVSVFGNMFDHNGATTEGSYKHQIYANSVQLGAGGLHPVQYLDVGWNEFANIEAGSDNRGGVVFFRNTSDGSGADHFYLHDNYFHGGNQNFVEIGDGALQGDIWMYNNLFVGGNSVNDMVSVRWTTSNANLFNNTFYQTGGATGNMVGIDGSGSGSQLISKNNLFYAASGGTFFGATGAYHGTINSDYDLFYNGTVPVSGNGLTVAHALFSNPQLVNGSGNDFHLQAASPAINAGTGAVSGIVSADYEWTPRPQGSGYDIGAFEYGSGYAPPPSDTQAPTVPSGLTATAQSSVQINLAWTASTDNVGVMGYRVFRNGTQLASTASLSYNDTGLTAGTLYSYSVLAYDTAGNTSSQSSPASATTQAVLPQISNLLGANTTATTTTISWNTNVPTNGQVFYGLSTSYGSQSSLLDNTTKTTTHIATLSSLTPSTLYHFKVTSIDSLSNSTSSPDFTFTTLALPVPPAPTISSFISNPSSISSGGSSTLSWTTTNSTQLTINNGVGAVTPVIGSGSKSVSPTQTTTYTLTATNGTATATAQTVVTIGSVVVSTSTPPAITSFTSDSSAITSGQPGVLSWVVTGSPSPTVTIDNGVGDVTSMSSKSVSPTANTTYTLTATNSAGTATAQVTLTVNPAPVVTPPGGGGGGGGGGGSGGTPSGTPSAPTVTYIPPASTVTTPASGTSSGALKLINISGTYYLISNGQRHGITNPGMLNSYGFSLSDAKPATETEKALPEGSLLLPGDGSLVKSKQDQTVYLISQGQRYGFTSAAVFTSLGFKFSSVLVVTDPELQALPKASQLLNNGTAAHLPGLDINRNGTVYWIGGDNTLHGYPSLAVYNSWHIANDFSRVVPANSADNSLPVGDLVQGRVVN